MADWLGAVGVSVTLAARNISALDDVAARIQSRGGQARVVPSDITSFTACRHAVAIGCDTFGPHDAIINNAAVVEPLARIQHTDPAHWQGAMATNLLGPAYLIHAALPALHRPGGRIINISTGAAQIPLIAAGAYCTSKAALDHLSRVVARETPGIVCIAIRPGTMDTPMQRLLRARGPRHMPTEQAAFYHRIHEDGLLEPPHVPGRAIAWAALHAPIQWSGSILDVDDPRLAEPALRFFGDCLE